MVGFFECGGIHGDLDGEGLDVGEVVVNGKVVAAAAVVAERSLRSRRRTTVAVTRAMIIQIVIGQSELNHRLSRRLTVLGDVDADFILGSDFGRDPSPLGGVGAEPNVGTHFHFGFKF